jgi:hypothetical protein
MEIRVSLNTQAADAAEIRNELSEELHALEQADLKIKTEQTEVEAGALSIFEAYQFVVEHAPVIAATATLSMPVITAVLNLSNAILQRRGLKRRLKQKSDERKGGRAHKPTAAQPMVVVQVGERSIELPAEDSQIKRYLRNIDKSSQVQPPSRSPKTAKDARKQQQKKKKTKASPSKRKA